MSVKVHEPVCEDSAQDLYFWFDHFLGDQIQDEWAITVDGAGTIAVVDQQTGGIARFTTDAPLDSDVELNWGDVRSLLVTKKVTIELRMKFNSIADVLTVFGLESLTSADRCMFTFVSATDVNWQLNCVDDGAVTTADSGIAADTNYHIFRIECFPTGQVHFYIDGVETANSPITTNIPTDADDYLQPRIFLRTKASPGAKILDVDYCVVRQER